MASGDEFHNIMNNLRSKTAEFDLLKSFEQETFKKINELKEENMTLHKEKNKVVLFHYQAQDLLRQTESDCKKQLLQDECQGKQYKVDIKKSNLNTKAVLQVKANREREFAVVYQELEQARSGYERERQLRIQGLDKFNRRLQEYQHQIISMGQNLQIITQPLEALCSKWTETTVKYEILSKLLENCVARSMELEVQISNLKKNASKLEASVQTDQTLTDAARATFDEEKAVLLERLAATRSEFASKAEVLLETRKTQLQRRQDLHAKIKDQTKTLDARIKEKLAKVKEYAAIGGELKAACALREQLVEAGVQRSEKSECESAVREQKFNLQMAECDLKETELLDELRNVKKA